MTEAKSLVLASTQAQSVLASYSEEQIAILRLHVAPGFSEAELAYGLTVAKARGLDPFAKQVYFTKRRQRQGDAWVERVTVEPTIDGFRVISARTGEMDGCEDPVWCGSDGVWRDVWLDREPPRAAKVTVYRRNHRKHYSAVAKFDEYAQRNKDGGLSQMWQKMPGAMLAKCAEALALRRAFPEALGGIYTHEEMQQADNLEAHYQIPSERPANVVSMPASRVETKQSVPYREKLATPNEQRRGDGLPDRWSDAEQVPAAIQLWWKPLQASGEIPVKALPIELAELVAEQCATARARAEGSPKSTKRLLDLLDAIGEAAANRVIQAQSEEVPE